jgi:hypothetical protein
MAKIPRAQIAHIKNVTDSNYRSIGPTRSSRFFYVISDRGLGAREGIAGTSVHARRIWRGDEPQTVMNALYQGAENVGKPSGGGPF